MKKTLLAVLSIAAVLFAGCEKTGQEQKKVNPVYFTSFGFYAEDNANVLSEDLVQTNISTVSVLNFEFPSDVLADSLKSLSARFEFPEGQDVKVTIGEGEDETEVESGDTLDFSSPVVFLLQKDNDYFQYTVNVTIAPSNWEVKASAPVTDTINSYISAAASPVSDDIYVAGLYKHKTSTTNYPIIYNFKSSLGSAVVLNEVQTTSEVAVGVSPTGVPYTVYLDYTTGSSAAKRTSSVSKLVNGKPELVGAAGKVNKFKYEPCVFPIADNNVYVAGQADGTTLGATKRMLAIDQYDGSAWTNKIEISGRDATRYGFITTGHVFNGVSYLLVLNNNSNVQHGISFYKNDGKGWSTIFEDLKLKNQKGEEVQEIYWYMDFAITSKGEILLLLSTTFDGTGYSHAIVKYDEQTKEQTILYGIIPEWSVGAKEEIRPKLLLDSNDLPYVTYITRDGSDRIFTTHVDKTTKTWTNGEPVSDFACHEGFKFVKNKSGEMYVFAVSNAAEDSQRLYVFGLKK